MFVLYSKPLSNTQIVMSARGARAAWAGPGHARGGRRGNDVSGGAGAWGCIWSGVEMKDAG